MRRLDISGQRFGRLLAISRLPTKILPSGRRRTVWECVCDCGGKVSVYLCQLREGKTQSCGCLKLDVIRSRFERNGTAKLHPLYEMWCGMRMRCYSKTNSAYKNYGGRGITICKRWRESFFAFADDMGERPAGMQIERINNDAGYSPENCKWATPKEQSRNRRNNVIFTFNGQTLCLTDWCKKLELPYRTISNRVWNLKWPIAKALEIEHKMEVA